MIPPDFTRRVQENPQIAVELLKLAHEGRRAVGDHIAPDHCYATGPMTGNAYRDLIECPACSYIAMFDEAMEKVQAADSKVAHAHYATELALDAAARTGEEVLREHQP